MDIRIGYKFQDAGAYAANVTVDIEVLDIFVKGKHNTTYVQYSFKAPGIQDTETNSLENIVRFHNWKRIEEA